MTCIVGLVENGVIYMGADSLASDTKGTSVLGRADEKVFINGDFIIGFAGSFRVGQLLRYAFEAPDKPKKHDDMAYMVINFIDAVRELHKEKGSLKREDEEEFHSVGLLVGYNGKLYSIEEDFDVGCPQDDYCCIGVGAQVANGAMYATRDMQMDPKKRITLALEAAARYDSVCRAPFVILEHRFA